VNCGPRSILLHSYYRLLFTSIIYFLANKYILPHDTFNPLFIANRWDWQPHCKLGQSTLVVLCVGSTLLLVESYTQIGAINKLSGAVTKLVSINLRKWFLSPTGSIKPWFHIKGNLPLCSSYLPLGVSNCVASTANQSSILGNQPTSPSSVVITLGAVDQCSTSQCGSNGYQTAEARK
jgi:hypothetical protein